MHHVDRNTPWDEIWQAMELLVQQGKVIYIGSSNFAALHIAQAQQAARTRSFLGLICEQSLYNLNARMIELEVIQACQEYGLGLIPWSPLASGMLGGALMTYLEGRRASDNIQKNIAKNLQKLEAFEQLCASIDQQPANVAIAWLLAQPAVTAPIIGPRTAEQLDENIKALEIDLSDEVLARLDEIFPGPGGRAPEAYAW